MSIENEKLEQMDSFSYRYLGLQITSDAEYKPNISEFFSQTWERLKHCFSTE